MSTAEVNNSKNADADSNVSAPTVAKSETTNPEAKKDQEKTVYSSEVISKAKALLDIFPQQNIDNMCEYISQAPERSLEELVQDYIGTL